MASARGGLVEAMRYAVLGGGKRVRPLLVYAAGEVSGAAPEVLDGAACAVELIHAYSLVHDDMPCMDDDELRRGKPTVHKKYGEAMAMLVGDALQALAFEALVKPMCSIGSRAATDVPVAEMVGVLAAAAGAGGMAGGQALDLGAVGTRLVAPATGDHAPVEDGSNACCLRSPGLARRRHAARRRRQGLRRLMPMRSALPSRWSTISST